MHRIESNSFLSNSDERSKVFWIQSIYFCCARTCKQRPMELQAWPWQIYTVANEEKECGELPISSAQSSN